MNKYRVLLDEKLEHHTRPFLNDTGIKTDGNTGHKLPEARR